MTQTFRWKLIKKGIVFVIGVLKNKRRIYERD